VPLICSLIQLLQLEVALLGRHVAHNREILGGWPLLTTRPKNKHAENAAIILQDIVFLVMPSLFLV
jgi:hypothetical protein